MFSSIFFKKSKLDYNIEAMVAQLIVCTESASIDVSSNPSNEAETAADNNLKEFLDKG